MTGGDRPARGGAPGPAAAGPRPAPSASARPARGGLFSPFRCFEAVPAAVLRCLRPRAFSSRRAGPAALRAGAGIALLLLALAAAMPAQAQTDVEVWRGTVTAGTESVTSAGVTFTNTGFSEGDFGSLSDKTLTVAGQTYTIDRALITDVTQSGVTTSANISLSFTSDLSSTVRNGLRLHVGSDAFAFRNATYTSSSHTLSWSNSMTGLSWSDGESVVLHLTDRENAAPTGLPVILGSARVGETLTASTAGIRDENGLTNVSYVYQWIRDDSGTETEISGATSSTYELAAADAGKQVKVKVSFTDDDGNDEELTSAAFPRSGTVAAALPPMMGPGELLSATLTAKSFITGDVGCGSGSGATGCGNSAVLDDNDFDIDTTSYTITALFERNGTITLSFTGGLSDADEGTHSLEVTEGGTTSTLKFSDGTTSSSAKYEWSGTGQSWSADDSVTVKVVSDPPDTTPPELVPPGTGSGVLRTGAIALFFVEGLDHSNRPPASAFAVTADGSPVAVIGVDGVISFLTLDVSPVILRGQTVVVTYTDPTSGDDANAIQDEAGNDAATFTTEVPNGSGITGLPGKPGNLTATRDATNPGTQIDLAWEAPSDIGLSDITGYRIERSADGNAPWMDLVADTGTTDLTYEDAGLPSPTTRHYRVSAINEQGAGPASDSAHATTDDVAGPVLVSARTTTTGSSVFLGFDENIGTASGLAISAFTVTADGVSVDIGLWEYVFDNAVGRTGVRLSDISPVIRQGQTVVVTYTDPNPGSNDATGVIQDAAGNDAASFTTGAGGVPAVTNNSTVSPAVPGAPESLAAAPGGDTSIELTWDPPADNGGRVVASYRIEVSEDVTPLVWQELEATHDTEVNGAIDTSYEHIGLEPGTTRHYRVRAKNSEGDGAWSGSVEAETTSGAPSAPPDLTATAGVPSPRDGTTLITLTWTVPTDTGDSVITGYRIEYSEDVAPLVWQELEADTGSTARRHVDEDLPSETTRHYRVSAINDDGEGPPSPVAHATTVDVAGPVPVSASVPVAGTSIAIVFDEALDETTERRPDAERFAVTAEDGARFRVSGVGVTGMTLTLTLHLTSPVIRTGQTVTVAYTDRTSANDVSGVVQDDDGNDAADFRLEPSGSVSVTNGSTVAVTAPGKPAGVGARGAGGDGIALTWEPPGDTGGRAITSYRIEVSTDGMSFTELVARHDTMSNDRIVTRYVHTGLEVNDERHYRVAARNGDAASDLGPVSDIVRAVTVHPDAPDPPTGLTATPGVPATPDDTTLITLTWSLPADAGGSPIEYYRIEYSEDVTPLIWQELVANTGSTVRRHVDEDLPSETTRHYRVAAVNGQGQGLWSSVADATTPDIVAPEFQSASVAATGRSVEIAYDEALDGTASRLPAAGRFAVTAADGARFRIGRVAVSGMTVTLDLHADSPVIRTGQAVTVAYTDRTASNDASGVVQDEAGNDAAGFTTGEGGVAAATNGSTQVPSAPGVPRGLRAEGGGTDSIVVSWAAPADNGGRAISGYVLEISTDGTTFPASAAVEITATDPNTGGVATEYTHTGLQITDTRHYRVSAKNEVGTGPASGVVTGVPVEPKGRVDVAFEPAGVSEDGGTATVVVTAVTDANAEPEQGFVLTVAVATEDGTAAAPGDYTALDATVTFGHGDFTPSNGRWEATKTVPVTIVDDFEAENAETFAVTARVTNTAVSLFVPRTERAEATIGANDPWAVAVSAAPSSMTEGETRGVALTARIVRGDGSVPPSNECLVPFAVDVGLAVEGTATGAGTDYTLTGATPAQQIAACSTDTVSWTVEIAAVVDAEDDGGDTVVFTPVLDGTPAVAPAEDEHMAGTVVLRELRSVSIDPIVLSVDEGGSAVYTVALTSRPTGPVTVTPQVSGDMEVTVTPPHLTFSGENWYLPQTLTVHAPQDADDEDETVPVSHFVSGADYAEVKAAGVRVAVRDDDKSFGVMTVRLSDGAEGADTRAPAPAAHDGDRFHVTLWWSGNVVRTDDFAYPSRAIGPDRAIRVTGATVRPVIERAVGKWTQSRLRLELTPENAATDVELVLEPLDCSYPDLARPDPNPHGLCAWRRGGGGITGLAQRVRWTVTGLGHVPGAPRNLTVEEDEIVTSDGFTTDVRRVLVAAFDADPYGAEWRVEAQAAGGDWSDPEVRSGAKRGSLHRVRLDGLDPDGAWYVRARWTNRTGTGPWAEAGTTDGPPLAAPGGFGIETGGDGRSVALSWTAQPAAARYQYRLSLPLAAGNWEDIPDSGPGAANRRSFAVDGLERPWEAGVRLRAVDRSGRAGAATAEARAPDAAPEVVAGRVRVTSDPGADGRYTAGDRIEVGVRMSRPVRLEDGTPAPTVTLGIGEEGREVEREAALERIDGRADSTGIGDYGAGDTLFFAYTVHGSDEDLDGISIPADGLRRLNGAGLVDATPGGSGRAATFRLAGALEFPGHLVQAAPKLDRIEWLDNRVWIHFESPLDPTVWRLQGAPAEQQFVPEFSKSTDGRVTDARIVRGRGWTQPCGRTETDCLTVRLTVAVRKQRGGTVGNFLNGVPLPDETLWIRYAPHEHLPQYRLRDAAGTEVPPFVREKAVRLAPGDVPTLRVDNAKARESGTGADSTMRFTVRLAPEATRAVTVDYQTVEGWDYGETVSVPSHGRFVAREGDDYRRTHGTLTFAPGDTVRTVSVPIVDDKVPDSGEVFTLVLANNDGAVLGDPVGRGTIRNDEALTAGFGALPSGHDGETAFTVGLAFSEEVAVSAAELAAALDVTGGSVTGARALDAGSTRSWEIDVAPSGAGDVTVVLAPRADCAAPRAVCTADGVALEAAVEAVVAHAVEALPALEVAGVPQVGGALAARFAEAPEGTVTYRWLRGGAEIAGAEASAYTAVAADAGAALSVRAESGAAAVTSAATAPVWPAPANPPLAAGEEELLSTVLTLQRHTFGTFVAGYGRVLGQSFGELDRAAFTEDGTTREVSLFAVNPVGDFVLATGAALPEAAGLAAYWNGHRIGTLETGTAGGLAVLTGRMPEAAAAEYGRYMDGSSDGVRVAVSLRRAPVTGSATHGVSARVSSGPGDNGAWDEDETVEVEVAFSGPVTVSGLDEGTPTVGVLLDGVRREAAYTGGSGTVALGFAYEVKAADAGARKARVVPASLVPNGAAIVDAAGLAVELGFAVAPHVTSVSVVPDGDGVWSPGETLAARVAFSEPVKVTIDEFKPSLQLRAGGATKFPGYASGSLTDTLVFSMTLPEGDAALSGLAVVADSLLATGATIVSASSGLAAELGHDGAEPTAAPEAAAPTALTAEFRDVPDAHGGSAFTLKLRFSKEFPLSWLTLRDHALAVTGGTLTEVSRAETGENKAWNVTVTPNAGAGDVTVTLAAASDCAAAGAICAAPDRPLSAPVSATVPAAVLASTPFKVRLEVPGEHDGESEVAFRVLFNKDPVDYSYVTLRDETVRIARGGDRLTPTGVKRLNAPASDRWSVRVAPGGKGDLTVSVGPFASCSDTGAVCAAGGEVLANAVAKTIPGPPGLSVADARAYEAAGAAVEFPVTLGRASGATVTVDYATGDGTAVAGEDYTETTGTLTFRPGETAKTVSVPVLDDGHDEGEETFTLTLSNPAGGNAWLKDAEATGTIENTDAMPEAWLARFGRTVAEQAIEAVEGRFAASRSAGVEVSVAGQRIGGAPEPEDAEARAKLAEEQEARGKLEAMTQWLRGADDEKGRTGPESRSVTARDLLTGSSFALTAEAASGGLVSLWGRGAVSRFDGREGDLSLDGEVASALLGADWARDRWIAGLMVSRSEGEGSYRGQGEGTVSSTLTAFWPYGRYAVNDRLTVWGMAGYGAGELTLMPDGQLAMRTGMDLAMGAVGLRGVAVKAPAEGGVELAVKTDAMAVRTSSEKAPGLAAAEADVTRLRLGLEGTWRGLEAGGGTLAPRLEVGVRHDGGDAETGFGLDLGGGLSWTHPASGVSAELRGRGLLTHESRGFRDRGLSGSFAWNPGQGSGRGPKLTLTQTMGASASGGADALLGQRHLGGLAANDNGSGDDLANRRLELRLGYGFPAFGDRFTSTPELGLGLSTGRREYSLGWRLGLVGSGANALELRIEGTRSEAVGANDNRDPEHGIGLRVTARW